MPDGSNGSLRFGSDAEPGIRRRGRARFTYVNERTGRQPSKRDLERISALAVPPAWTDVWIAADPTSHLQATGRDARGRKQYRYHGDFTASRSENKFADLVTFGAALGRLRRRVDRDLRSERARSRSVSWRWWSGCSISPVFGSATPSTHAPTSRSASPRCATDTRWCAARRSTCRSEASRRTSSTSASTTLGWRVSSGGVRTSRANSCSSTGRRTVSCATIGSTDVNAYLAEHGNVSMSAKAFRTWNATVLAAEGFVQAAGDDGEPTARVVNEVIDQVAGELGQHAGGVPHQLRPSRHRHVVPRRDARAAVATARSAPSPPGSRWSNAECCAC